MQFKGLTGAITLALVVSPAQPAYADEDKCKAGANYAGAPLRPSLDLSAMPIGRTLSRHPFSAAQTKLLDQTVDELSKRSGVAAASLTIWKPGTGYWTREIGTSNVETDRFWWASTGKLATATVVLQLIDEGKLVSTAPISQYFPEFKHASVATIGDLLSHTSGIFSFQADLKHRKRSGYSSPDDLIAVADKHELGFCPGTNWNYSNTGYVMLARIAEQVERKNFADIVAQRIAQPLGLNSFRLLTRDDTASAMVPLASDRSDGVSEIASVFGAGGIVANSGDMLAFLHAYLESGLVSQQARDQAVATLYPMFGTNMSYGTGIMVTDVPDETSPTVWLGHSGGSPDAKALLIYDVKRDTYLAVALNSQAPAEAIANSLLKLLD